MAPSATASALAVTLLLVSLASIEAKGSCKPVTLIFTRVTGSSAILNSTTKSYQDKHEPINANFANIEGAFKFLITECIDYATGYTKVGDMKCRRKNGAAFIHFYKFQVCNPDATLWWFSEARKDDYGQKSAATIREFGYYSTFDEGQCHDMYCPYLFGDEENPKLGPFVGWKDDSTDVRCPIPHSYWFSVPGECPLKVRAEKLEKCKEDFPSGRCKGKDIPDGEKCTFNFELLGQVEIDDLTGVRNIMNPNTGKFYGGHVEYCQDSKIEFLRDSNDFDFVEGLPFWEDPKNVERNVERVNHLMTAYANKTLNPYNKEIPSADSLRASNPPCYQTVRRCGDGKVPNTVKCRRDDSMICVNCKSGDNCPDLPHDWEKTRLPELPIVKLPEKPVTVTPTSAENNTSGDNVEPSSHASLSQLSIISFVLATVSVTVLLN